MRVEFSILASAFATSTAAASSAKCPSFPSSVVEYSSNFKQPAPPLVKSEYATSFIQHKWYARPNLPSGLFTTPANFTDRNENISHITAGYITNSASQGFVRVEEAYDGKLASSFFDYANVTEEGLVDNTLTEYDGNSTEPAAVFRGYVNSNYPIFQNSILTDSDAVFGGLVERRFSNDHVAAVSFYKAPPKSKQWPSLTRLEVEHRVYGGYPGDNLLG